MTGIELITKERERQINELGFTPEKDDQLVKSELLYLAKYCIFSNNDNIPKGENSHWHIDYIKQIHLKTRIEQLTIAAACIGTEIDRRLRLNNPELL